MKVTAVTLFIVIICQLQAYSQVNIPIGTWRNHFSFNNVQQLVDAEDRVYASATNGIFVFDKSDNSIRTISSFEGLQDQSISSIAFDKSTNQLLIGYRSGNLDILLDNEIFNIDLTSTSQVIGSKEINDIVFYQNVAFLITDFGVLKFDLLNRRVTETYRELSSTFDLLEVYEAAVYRDSIYLASEEGVLSANITGQINLLNPNNWFRFSIADGIPAQPFDVMTSTNQGVIAGSNINGLYTYTQSWDELEVFTNTSISSLTSNGNEVLLVSDSAVFLSEDQLIFQEIENEFIINPNDAIVDSNGNIWVADQLNALVTDFTGTFQTIAPSGPFSDKVFKLSFLDQQMFALPGGYNENIRPLNCDLGYYSFINGFWENFNSFSQGNPFPSFDDITNVVIENSTQQVIFSSAKDGLLRINSESEFEIINHLTSGSPLQNTGANNTEVIIPSILNTREGVWVLNYGATTPLHLLRADGTWQSFVLPSNFVVDLIEVGNTLWILPNPETVGGIIVFNKETGNSRYLSTIPGNGGLTGDEVRTLALDFDGLVWAGTQDGVSVFTNPLSVLNGEVEAIEPIFNNRLLLRGEEITVITVDGGNQKWIGTRNGVWLFDDQADEQIFNFTTSNSPLPSNNILDIEINQATGEVFFGTEAGIVSFRGDATASEVAHNNVEIFPNPVTRDFVGKVGISGLATDAIVKITDVSGKLIYESQANGGSASWDVNDYRGSRANTGVYLVFSSSSDGEETFVGKIAVVE